MPQPTQPDGHPTKLDEMERIDRTIELIVRTPKTTAIIRTICQEFGVAESTAYDYLRKAREQMMEDTRCDRRNLIAEGIAFYKSIWAAPHAKNSDRLKAFDGLRRMLGLDAAQKVEITSPLAQFPDEQFDELARQAGLRTDQGD